MGPNTRPIRASGDFEALGLGIPGPLLIVPRRFRDRPGLFLEARSERTGRALGMAERFSQNKHSRSAAAGTVRGMHFQEAPRAQAKLVRVLRGAVPDAAVDLRPGPPTSGRHDGTELSAADARRIYVSAGFAHGFCTRKADTEVAYKADDYCDPSLERCPAWDDPDLSLPWPGPVPADGAVLSDKDRRQPRFRDLAAGAAP